MLLNRLLNLKKGKSRAILFCVLFVVIQVSQSLLWREDFPFTKWGMYHRLPSSENLLIIETRVDGKKIGLDDSKDPWSLRRELAFLLDYEKLRRAHPKNHDDIPQWLYDRIASEQHQIRSLMRKNLKNPNQDGERMIESFLLGWTEFSRDKKDTPDWKIKIYGSPVHEL